MALLVGVADGADRLLVGAVVALGVGEGARRFAEHVIGIGVAAFFLFCRPVHRFVNIAAKDELLAEFAHRLRHRFADDRFADPFHQRVQRACNIATRAIVFTQHFAGQHQSPGRSVDK